MLFEERVVKNWQLLGLFLIILMLVLGTFFALSGVNNLRHAFNVCIKELDVVSQRPEYCAEGTPAVSQGLDFNIVSNGPESPQIVYK